MKINYSYLKADLLEEVVDLWNREAAYDAMTLERFSKEILADQNFDPEWTVVAMDGNRVVGMLIGVHRKFPYQERGTEPHRCFINMLAVDEDYQDRGIGSAMLDIFEDTAKAKDKKLITVGAYSPYYLFPGVDIRYQKALNLFNSRDYEIYADAVAMSIDLSSYEYPSIVKDKKESLVKKGFQFGRFQYEDTQELLIFLGKEFGGGWKKNAMDAILRGEAEKTIILCKDKEGSIIGSVQRSMDGNEGRYGPFGVSEEYRNLGLGTVLFHEMMWSMLKEKIYHAYFLWSGGDAQRFYERQGMKVFREFKLCKKEL